MQQPYGSWVDAPSGETAPLTEPEDFTSGNFRSLLDRIESRASNRADRFLQQLSLRLALLWVSFSIALTMTRFASGAFLRRLR